MPARKRAAATKAAESSTSASPRRAAASDAPAAAARRRLNTPRPLRLLCALLSLACATYLAAPWLLARLDASSPPRAASSSTLRTSPPGFDADTPYAPQPALPFRQAPLAYPNRTSRLRSVDALRRNAIKLAFTDSWAAYAADAWPADEYHPLSHGGTNLSDEGPVGYTIIDALDTMLLMGLQDEYRKARDWVRDHLTWERGGRFNVFETTIRSLGGLLSASALCSEHAVASQLCDAGDAALFLSRAEDLALRLTPAFAATKTGVPLREVNFKTGEVYADQDNQGKASLAEATTVQLEFKYLAHLTGTKAYWRLAERPMEVVRKATQSGPSDGLLPIFLSPDTGKFWMSDIRLGSRGDSYYEYLIKQHLQTNRTEGVYRNMYDRAMSGVKKHLVKQSTFSKPPLLYTAEISPRLLQGHDRPVFTLIPKQDHLVCFLGGSFMLGALSSSPASAWRSSSRDDLDDLQPYAQEDWSVGHELIRTCYDTYRGTKSKLAPEIAMFRLEDEAEARFEDWYIKQAPRAAPHIPRPSPLIDARNILRPETVESLFIAFQLSGDPIYRQWGWDIFQAFVRHARLPSGAFASIKNVQADLFDEGIEHEDRMESFWLSETLKYLYLLC
ncbi:seven-hairpin glycosidase, partial [Tilletiopsis washingtonensis]